MKADDLIDAFGNIDPKYVSDAEVEIKSKSQMKRMFYVIREKISLEKEQPAHITISAAMCMTAVVLIIGAGMFYGRIRDGYSGSKNNSVETVFKAQNINVEKIKELQSLHKVKFNQFIRYQNLYSDSPTHDWYESYVIIFIAFSLAALIIIAIIKKVAKKPRTPTVKS